MKVVLPEKKVFTKTQLAVYITIIVICIISLIIASYVQFYARIDFGKLWGEGRISAYGKKTDEEVETIKAGFDQIFTNKIANEEGHEDKKKETDKLLVYTNFEGKESKLNSYDVNINIPYINIDNEKIEEYNKGIEEIFVNKARSVLESQNKNIIYTVEYVADIQFDILSLMIRANLKEGSQPQRIIIQTYNYDLRNNKEISLAEVLKIEDLDETDVQGRIKNEIELEQKRVNDIKELLGSDVYNRDISSDIYKIEKTTEFYLTSDTLYLIYAYGNTTQTTEMDLVVL